MLTGMRMSIQAELDTFFAHLRQQAQLVHEVSEQAFSQARAKLSLTFANATEPALINCLFQGIMLSQMLLFATAHTDAPEQSSGNHFNYE